MIKNIYSILCESSIIDKDTNNLTINNVLEQLKINVAFNGKQPPQDSLKINIPIKYEFISLWKRDNITQNETHEIELTISDPNNNLIQSFPQKFQFEKGLNRHRSIFKITGFTATISGTYKFNIKIKVDNTFKEFAEVPLEVDIIKTNQPTQTNPN